VDAEGLDYSILNSNDWNKYRPKVVLVELLNKNIDGIFKDKIYNLLANNGYLFFSKCVNTAIFIENNFCKARFDIK